MIRESLSDKLLKSVFYVIVAVFAVYCFVPFFAVLASSFTTESEILRNGYMIFLRNSVWKPIS